MNQSNTHPAFGPQPARLVIVLIFIVLTGAVLAAQRVHQEPGPRIEIAAFSDRPINVSLYNSEGHRMGDVFNGTLDSGATLRRAWFYSGDGSGAETGVTHLADLPTGFYFYRASSPDTTFVGGLSVVYDSMYWKRVTVRIRANVDSCKQIRGTVYDPNHEQIGWFVDSLLCQTVDLRIAELMAVESLSDGGVDTTYERFDTLPGGSYYWDLKSDDSSFFRRGVFKKP